MGLVFWDRDGGRPDDPVQRRNGRYQWTGKEADSHLEASLTSGGVDRGDGNNTIIKLSNRD